MGKARCDYSLDSSPRDIRVGLRGRLSYCEFIFSKLNFYGCSLEKLKLLSKDGWSKYVKQRVHSVALAEWQDLVSSSKLLSYDYNFIKLYPAVENQP